MKTIEEIINWLSNSTNLCATLIAAALLCFVAYRNTSGVVSVLYLLAGLAATTASIITGLKVVADNMGTI